MILTRARKRVMESQQAARTSTKTPPPGKELDEGCPIAYWIQRGVWPKAYINEDPQNKKIAMSRFLASKSLLAKKKYLVSWRLSEPRSISSDKGDQSNHAWVFIQQLQLHGSFLETLEFEIANESEKFCTTLINNQQKLPRESLFNDDIFQITCRRVRNKNKAVIIRDILPLIAPPTEIYALHTPKLDYMIESVNEVWSNCQPIISNYPQPDYSVGFKRKAFTYRGTVK